MNLPISLEFFPPKTPEGAAKLRLARQALYAVKPEFCSVTYGAGGSTQATTLDIVARVHREFCLPVATHLTCVGRSVDELLVGPPRLGELLLGCRVEHGPRYIVLPDVDHGW